MDLRIVTGYLVTFSVLIPITAGVIRFSFLNRALKFFILYLVIGFLKDASEPIINNSLINQITFNLYSLFEFLFLVWFLMQLSAVSKVKTIYRYILLVLIPFWMYAHYRAAGSLNITTYSALFDSVSAIVISFIAAFELLELTKKGINLTQQYAFWFVTGIFFYFFCCNFLFGFLEMDFLRSIWFLHNIICIITYLVITKGFLCVREKVN